MAVENFFDDAVDDDLKDLEILEGIVNGEFVAITPAFKVHRSANFDADDVVDPFNEAAVEATSAVVRIAAGATKDSRSDATTVTGLPLLDDEEDDAPGFPRLLIMTSIFGPKLHSKKK